MKRYRNVEGEVERALIEWPYDTSGSRFINLSRKFANRIQYTDDEILRIARNRIRFCDARHDNLLAKAANGWRRLLGLQAKEEMLRVAGHELNVLMSMAQVEDDDSIQVTHEYEVHPHYYRFLVDRAVARAPDG